MVEIRQGEVWWADLSEPSGFGPGFRRPILVIQGNPSKKTKIKFYLLPYFMQLLLGFLLNMYMPLSPPSLA